MTEAELVQASAVWANLAYTTSQWWLTVTTALVLATYFAAKNIAPWFFALIVLLYMTTAISVIFELSEYSNLSFIYGTRIVQLAHPELNANVIPSTFDRLVNNYANCIIIALGTFGAISFSFVHWRKARSGE
ncbi:MAG TPA: hypothetical protein VGH02_07250 [Rhizomicrobium sp.]|jgi:hypothetical protein